MECWESDPMTWLPVVELSFIIKLDQKRPTEANLLSIIPVADINKIIIDYYAAQYVWYYLDCLNLRSYLYLIKRLNKSNNYSGYCISKWRDKLVDQKPELLDEVENYEEEMQTWMQKMWKRMCSQKAIFETHKWYFYNREKAEVFLEDIFKYVRHHDPDDEEYFVVPETIYQKQESLQKKMEELNRQMEETKKTLEETKKMFATNQNSNEMEWYKWKSIKKEESENKVKKKKMQQRKRKGDDDDVRKEKKSKRIIESSSSSSSSLLLYSSSSLSSSLS